MFKTSAGDEILITDATKPNVQYMCWWRLTASQWAEKATKVTAVLTVAGSVSDYDAAKQVQVRQAIATSASVQLDHVSLTVTAASVQLKIEIFVADAATVTSLTTALTATGGMLASGTAFQTAMTSGGVTVAVEAITVVSENTPPPSAPSSDDDGHRRHRRHRRWLPRLRLGRRRRCRILRYGLKKGKLRVATIALRPKRRYVAAPHRHVWISRHLTVREG